MTNNKIAVWAVFVGGVLYKYGSRYEMNNLWQELPDVEKSKGACLGCKRVYVRKGETLAEAMKRPNNYEP